ncbi:PREDICTED: S-(+)-linalool synthase, chloroplastic-like [Tarenaya hassleriana]|uniref:S-(+)-linalool synthase, chloroplastic-like n=1 Tax=Tarenaya hassleriana TaxID=28532 RepID=UPI00053C1498|nr:PREDICTED: S-(+)-linalool synthase, chloroplastic-like [Tarenaya hassleriana]
MALIVPNTVPFSCSVEPNKTSMSFRSDFLCPITSSRTQKNAKKFIASYGYAPVSTPLETSNDQISDYICVADEEKMVKKKLRSTLSEKGEPTLETLEMVDAIQRLSIEHHVFIEIKETLRKLHMQRHRYNYHGRDLREVSLCFRLLRQEGYHVSAESLFGDFQDKDRGFKGELENDIKGLLELFEASQLSIEGEDILENAREFAGNNLVRLSLIRESYQGRVITDVLHKPYHKTLSRITAKRFIEVIDVVHGGKEWLQSLLQVAEIDQSLLKTLHQEEASIILKWWRELGLTGEVRKARDQPLKWHAWTVAVNQDPGLSQLRVAMAKVIPLVYILDDIFDVYGGIDELTIFTQVVERWNYGDLEKLPNHMKVFFKTLDMITMEISHKIYKEHGWNPIKSLQKSWARLCEAFLVEARWFESGYLPNKEEYLENGIVSSGVHLVMLHFFYLLGEEITDEKAELMENNPKIVSSVATILRLHDDLGSAKDEKQDGFDGSYVRCYVNQHQGSTVEEARTHSLQMISEAWKRLNEECLNPNPFSGSSFAKACLNVARTVPLMYTYDGDHRLPGLDDYLKSLVSDRFNPC